MTLAFKDRVESIMEYLPTAPAMLPKLLETLHNENSTIQDLESIINKDPSLTVNILRLANSAFYSLSYKVTSVDKAVAIIGFERLKSLCVAHMCGKSLFPSKNECSVDSLSYWSHSLATGAIAKALCMEAGMAPLETLNTMGLIHDIGVVILDRFFHNIYKMIVELTYEENVSLYDVEIRTLSVSHATVGGWLLQQWKLPEEYVEVASYHHAVNQAPEKNRLQIAIVSLADEIARLKGFGIGGDKSGTIIADTEAFSVIKQHSTSIGDTDLARFVMDLDREDNGILKLGKMIDGS